MGQRPKSLGLALLMWLGARPAPAADFVGAESCRACHRAAYDQWAASPHAKAYQMLSADQQKDARCLLCHARDQAQGGDPGVTCETCHGAGQYYWPDYVMRDRELAHAAGLLKINASDIKLCSECHDGTGPSLAPFDPAQKMKEIDHWSNQRAAASPKPRCPGQVASAVLPWDTFVGRALRAKASPGKHGKAARQRAVPVAVALHPAVGNG